MFANLCLGILGNINLFILQGHLNIAKSINEALYIFLSDMIVFSLDWH